MNVRYKRNIMQPCGCVRVPRPGLPSPSRCQVDPGCYRGAHQPASHTWQCICVRTYTRREINVTFLYDDYNPSTHAATISTLPPTAVITNHWSKISEPRNDCRFNKCFYSSSSMLFTRYVTYCYRYAILKRIANINVMEIWSYEWFKYK